MARAIERGATHLDKMCHKLYDEPKGHGFQVDGECRHCGGHLMTYYCEDRLYLIACEKCGALALTKSAAPQVAANLTLRKPTITPPNETPPCYQPDGDGCAYQCYDGQDEPIDKCKECPLCYSDKQRQHTPPNEPLTLEQLREMGGDPVWVEGIKRWAIVKLNCKGVFLHTTSGEFEVDPLGRDKIYRRPPEGET